MKLSDIFKTKNQKLIATLSKNETVKIDKKQLAKLIGGTEETEGKKAIIGKAESSVA